MAVPPRELSVIKPYPTKPRAGAGLVMLTLAAALLAGCSGRDTDSAEKIAQINAATQRAEKAAERAEAAAAQAAKGAAPTVIEMEPESPDDEEAKKIAEQNEPLAPDADLKE